jgi:predicted RNA-binding Zn-ribbon protein involved in translation (DUF1610 family)
MSATTPLPCPTCGETMHAMGCKVTASDFHWCPRCGTIKPCEEQEAVAPCDATAKYRGTPAGERAGSDWRDYR